MTAALGFCTQVFRKTVTAIRQLHVHLNTVRACLPATVERPVCIKRWSMRSTFSLWNTCKHRCLLGPVLTRPLFELHWQSAVGQMKALGIALLPTWRATQPPQYNVFLYSNINVHKYLHMAFHKHSAVKCNYLKVFRKQTQKYWELT